MKGESESGKNIPEAPKQEFVGGGGDGEERRSIDWEFFVRIVGRLVEGGLV